MTIKKGAWFGDYQIMLNVLSSWDLVAGSDEEFNTNKRPRNVPINEIMVYTLDGELFKNILD